MKLYKFNYNNEIMECEIVKETKRTYVYNLPYSKIDFTILKKELDAPIGARYRDVVATSREKLIEISLLIVDVNIEFYRNKIERLKEEKRSINEYLS